MLTISSLVLMLIVTLIVFNIVNNNYFFSSVLTVMVFLGLSNLSFFVDWILLSVGFGFNNYSYGLILLTLYIMSLVMLMLKYELDVLYCINLLIMMMLIMLLNFLSINVMMFYFLFESSLVMIFILLVKWGMGVLRIMAGYYLMFYTLFFSLPLLIILLMIIYLNGSESFIIMEKFYLDVDLCLFVFMVCSFLVKFPMFLFHSWLLKAHVEAPVYGSMILAAIMLKLGSYGLLRLIMIFYYNFILVNEYIMELSLVGSILLSLMCFRQIDMKIIVALSSVVHMGLMLSSMMTLLKISMLGSYVMMIAHGLCSSGMFYMVNLCYENTNSRLLIINKGIMVFMPSMSLMWFLMCSSNMAAPFSLNLIGEIMLLLGLVVYSNYLIILLFIYCLLSFMYSLYFFSYINHGFFNFYMAISSGKLINYFILLAHWIPLNLMVFNLSILI